MADVVLMNDVEARAVAAGIDLSELDLSSIYLPKGENFGIISDDEDVCHEEQLDFEASIGNIIVVDKIPVAPEEKFEKLEKLVRKIYTQIGSIKEDSLWIPVDPGTQKTLGYSFMFESTLRWSGGKSDKYFAKIGRNMISVYETETFSLIGKKSLKVENVIDFSWSPTDPILALFVPEQAGGNQPARVSLVQIPSKEEIRQTKLFSVSGCKMYWQSNGEYLAIKVDRYTKSKKTTNSGFELFRIKERDIPIEVLELDNKNDTIIAFSWEPKGHRFAVVHGDNPRPDVSFYSMMTDHNSSRVSKLTTLKGKQANAVFWSPIGHYIVLGGLNGQLEFFNVDELVTMATSEHFMATNIEWDPTGRYVATSVTSIHHEMENGFVIWSFHGRQLYRILKDNLFQFSWRPRPPSILSPEKEEEIVSNLKSYSMRYEVEDQYISLQLSELEREKRRMLNDKWENWVDLWKSLHHEEKWERMNLREGEASDEEEEVYEAEEVHVEDLLDVSDEILSE